MAKLPAGVSQKDYLQKYLTGKDADKKKKKRKIPKIAKEKRSVIVDDDDVKTMRELADGELDLFSMSEDAPQIAGIIDERPEELRTLETFRSSARWKVISDEHGIEDIRVVAIPRQQQSAENSDDDLSPARNTRDDSDESPPRKGAKDDSDESPPRSKGRNENDSDVSPPRVKLKSAGKTNRDSLRGNRHDSDLKELRTKPLSNLSSDDSRWGKKANKATSPSSKHDRKDADRSRHSRRDGYLDEKSARRNEIDTLNNFRDETQLHRNRHKTNQQPEDENRQSKGRHDLSGANFKQGSSRATAHSERNYNHGDKGDSFGQARIKKEPVSPLRNEAGGHHDDSDESPPRRNSGKAREPSPSSKHRKHKSSDHSELSSRKSGNKSKKDDSDESPPRKHKAQANDELIDVSRSHRHGQKVSQDSDKSPPRRSRKTYEESGESPRRKSKHTSREYDNGSSRKNSKQAREDSDESPPRKSKQTSRENDNEPSRKNSKQTREDYDESPRRKSKHKSREYDNESSRKNSKHVREDSDESPPRKSKQASRENKDEPPPKKSRRPREGSEGPSPRGAEGPRLSEGPPRDGASREKGGGQSGPGRSTAAFTDADNAPIYRDRKTGRKRDLAEEAQQRAEEGAKVDVAKEKYTRWGKGLAQVAECETRAREAVREAAKPVARFADDADLDAMLRAREREGDPMLAYLQAKATDVSLPSKPRYLGTFAPNRYGIAPGHRWDGVDRSTGFERRWFEGAAARQAVAEDAYKWSVADM